MLNKFEDMNYADIADVMGLTSKAVKSLLSRARAKLREVLQGYIYMDSDPPPPPPEDEEEDYNDFEGKLEIVEDQGADDLEILDDETDLGDDIPVAVVKRADDISRSSRVALPVVTSRGWDDTGGDEELPDDDAFSLSRSGPATVEELDLAPMVDVAFQLVLFFMVAAQTVLYKTLEIPKPSQEQAPSAVAQEPITL